MRKRLLWVVVSDSLSGDGGGKWLAATPTQIDQNYIAEMLGGIAATHPIDAVDDGGKIRFLGTVGCPIYPRAWDCAEALILAQFADGGSAEAVIRFYRNAFSARELRFARSDDD